MRIQALVVAACVAAFPLAAQDADPRDVASVDAIIRAYYEAVSGPAGGRVDVARDRSLHHPNAWVAIAGKDSAGRPTVRVLTLAG
ncbi:MAG: hypothetical protein JNJ98_03815, partial [Gemmatimonadetes bacterium]|nr:hypothetical protein [Gemmatimonadota bacterium]